MQFVKNSKYGEFAPHARGQSMDYECVVLAKLLNSSTLSSVAKDNESQLFPFQLISRSSLIVIYIYIYIYKF